MAICCGLTDDVLTFGKDLLKTVPRMRWIPRIDGGIAVFFNNCAYKILPLPIGPYNH